MQTKHRLLILVLLWLSSSPLWGQQRFRNASDFMGDSAQQQLIQPESIKLPSNELLLYQPSFDPGQLPNRQDSYRVLDFVKINNDPESSLLLRHRYQFTEADPQGTTASQIPSTPEMVAAVGDFDGDGYDEVIRAMEDDHGEILCFFYDSVGVGNDASETALLGASALIHRVAAPAGGYVPVLDGHPTLMLKAVNLGKSDRDHLIICYLRRVSSTLFQLSVDLWQDSLVASHVIDIPTVTAQHIDFPPPFDLATGDFELDGVPEIAVVYQRPLVATLVDGATASSIQMAPHLTLLKFEQQQLHVEIDQEVDGGIGTIRNYFQINQYSSNLYVKHSANVLIFDVNNDLVPEVIMLNPAGTISQQGNPFVFLNTINGFKLTGNIFQLWDDTTRQGTNLFDTLLQVGRISPNTYIWNNNSPLFSDLSDLLLSTEVETGDVDGDNRPELVFGFYRYRIAGGQCQTSEIGVGVLELETPISNPDTVIATSTYNRIMFGGAWQPYPIPRRFLAVSDLDGDGVEEIVRYRKAGSNTILEAFAYSPPPASGSEGTVEIVGQQTIPTGTGFASFQLLAGDFDGDGLRLGTPQYYRKTSIQQPLVILNAPPVHFDHLNGQNYDISGCYPGQACDFSTTYRQITTQAFTASTEFHSDWAVSAAVSGSVSTGAVKVKGKISSTYGQSFSSYRGMGQSIAIKSEVTATVEDLIYATVLDYGIYEYPIYQRDSLIGHVMTITPELSQNRWFSTDSWSGFDYFPRHEVGNLMSYEGFFNANEQTDLTLDPTLDEPIKLMGDGLEINGSSQYAPGVSISDFSSGATQRGSSLSVGAEASVTAGKKLFGLGVEVTVSVSGDYSQEQISTFETEVSNDISVDINLGPHTAGLESNYIVSPYVYWGKNGSLTVDYTVQPEVQNLGGTNTWWNAYYGQEQDPGLILPWRLHAEKGLILQEPIKQLQSKSITYSPRDAQPGDTITIYAAVHNFSLLPTTGRVEAAFYLGNPNCGSGQRLTSVDGQTSAFSEETFIPARGRRLVAFKWRIPETITTAPRLFVQLDPDDGMSEIHEGNNLGWTILSVQGSGPTQYCNELTSTTSLAEAKSSSPVSAFPNPFTQRTTLRFDLPQSAAVKLEVLDPTGRQVARLIDGFLPAGQQEASFDGGDLPAGIYLYRLQTGDQVQSGRLQLLR